MSTRIKAVFTYAVCYKISVKCLSPMRSGGADGDTELILRDSQNRPIIQGTSVAGAMRDWIHRDCGLDNLLFGSQENEGIVCVSDIVFDENTNTSVRPRLRIDGASGTAENGAKFDLMHLEKDSMGEFSVICRVKTQEDLQKAENQLERCFSAFNEGSICLGGQKSNGFGRVTLSVKKRIFDMTNVNDRQAWIDELEGEKIQLASLSEKPIKLNISMQTRSILVKSGINEKIDGQRTATALCEKGVPVIPGSSIKGAVIAQIRRFAEVCGIAEGELGEMFGTQSSENDMGSAGRIYFSDGYFEKNKAKQAVQIRIRINRLSGGVIDKAMSKENVLGGTVSWDITVSDKLKNPKRAAAILLFAMRDLGMGIYNLGSGYAVGRGQSEKLIISCEGSEMICENGRISMKDESGLFKAWLDELGGEQE